MFRSNPHASAPALLVSAVVAATAAGGGPRAAETGPAPELRVTFVDSDAHAFSGEERETIESIARNALVEIADHLPDAPDDIELVVQTGPQVIPETGEGGVALAPGRIAWTVDPARPGGVIAVARARLRITLFHEVHHLVRGWTIEGGTVGIRMIDAAVSEGMATAFERDATGTRPPWGEYPADEVEGWVDELLEAPGFEAYATFMLQHPDGRRWIGYRAGTWLADRAMAACGCSAADLVSTPTDEILELAGVEAGREGEMRGRRRAVL
jgi:hypothetical protein